MPICFSFQIFKVFSYLKVQNYKGHHWLVAIIKAYGMHKLIKFHIIMWHDFIIWHNRSWRNMELSVIFHAKSKGGIQIRYVLLIGALWYCVKFSNLPGLCTHHAKFSRLTLYTLCQGQTIYVYTACVIMLMYNNPLLSLFTCIKLPVTDLKWKIMTPLIHVLLAQEHVQDLESSTWSHNSTQLM